MEIDDRTYALPGTSLSSHVARPSAPGTPVVLLHPWFGCWQFWTSTMEHLADRPCYAVDFYSPSSGDWGGIASPTGLADAVLTMLDAEGLERVDVVGNSVGGIVAQVVASTAPRRVRRLVLVGTGANTRGALPGFATAVDRWLALAPDGGAAREGHAAGGPAGQGRPAREGDAAFRAAVEDTVGLLFTGRPDDATFQTYVQAVLRADPAYLAAVLGAARQLDLVPRLGAVTAPTLIVRGSEDSARSAEHSAVLAAGIPDARSVEMPGAGHSPMVDHPAEFAELVAAHLDDEAVAGGGADRAPAGAAADGAVACTEAHRVPAGAE